MTIRVVGAVTRGRANSACALERHEQQGLHLRPDDRTPCGERVRRGAGRRGTHDAVAQPSRQGPPVDLDHQVQHPVLRRLLDRDLVERPGVHDLDAVVEDPGVDRHALLDPVVTGDDGLHDLLQVLALQLGEEADVPEVHAQEGDAHPARALRTTQDRSVAAEHDDQLASGGRRAFGQRVDRDHAGDGQDLALVAGGGHTHALVQQRLGGRTGRGDGLLTARVRDQQDPSITHRGTLLRRGPGHCGPSSHCAADVRRIGRTRIGPQMKKVLDVAAGTRQRAGHHPGSPEPDLPRGPGDLKDGGLAQRGLADDPTAAERLTPHLELRLDHQQQVGALGHDRRRARRGPAAAR